MAIRVSDEQQRIYEQALRDMHAQNRAMSERAMGAINSYGGHGLDAAQQYQQPLNDYCERELEQQAARRRALILLAQ